MLVETVKKTMQLMLERSGRVCENENLCTVHFFKQINRNI